MQGKVVKVPLAFHQRFLKNILIGNLLLIAGILISTIIDWNYSVLLNVTIGIAIAVGFRMGLLTFLLDFKDHRQFIRWLKEHPEGKVLFYRKNKRKHNLFFVDQIIPVLSRKIHLCNQHRGTVPPHIRRQFFMFNTSFKRPLLITVHVVYKTGVNIIDQDQADYFTTTFVTLKTAVEEALVSRDVSKFKQL